MFMKDPFIAKAIQTKAFESKVFESKDSNLNDIDEYINTPEKVEQHSGKILWLVRFACLSDNLILFKTMTNLLSSINYQEYYELALNNFNLEIVKYLHQFCEVDENIYDNIFQNVCEFNEKEMFMWLYENKREIFDKNVLNYFKCCLRLTSFNNNSILHFIYDLGLIDLNLVGEECIYEAINYGNDKIVAWLIRLGARVENTDMAIDILGLCNWNTFHLYFDFFLENEEQKQHAIKKLLKNPSSSCPEKLRFLLDNTSSPLEDLTYLNAHSDSYIEMLFEKQMPSYECYSKLLIHNEFLNKYASYYQTQNDDENAEIARQNQLKEEKEREFREKEREYKEKHDAMMKKLHFLAENPDAIIEKFEVLKEKANGILEMKTQTINGRIK